MAITTPKNFAISTYDLHEREVFMRAQRAAMMDYFAGKGPLNAVRLDLDFVEKEFTRRVLEAFRGKHILDNFKGFVQDVLRG